MIMLFYSILRILNKWTQNVEIPNWKREGMTIRNKKNEHNSQPSSLSHAKKKKIQKRSIGKGGQIENRK